MPLTLVQSIVSYMVPRELPRNELRASNSEHRWVLDPAHKKKAERMALWGAMSTPRFHDPEEVLWDELGNGNGNVLDKFLRKNQPEGREIV